MEKCFLKRKKWKKKSKNEKKKKKEKLNNRIPTRRKKKIILGCNWHEELPGQQRWTVKGYKGSFKCQCSWSDYAEGTCVHLHVLFQRLPCFTTVTWDRWTGWPVLVGPSSGHVFPNKANRITHHDLFSNLPPLYAKTLLRVWESIW